MGYLTHARQFQLGYVTRDIDAGIDHLVDVLGAQQLTRYDDFHSPGGERSSIGNLAHFRLAELEVELIQPREDWDGSIYLDALPRDGQVIALHHIGYLFESMSDFRAASQEARQSGIDAPAEGGSEQAAYAYLDTRASTGLFTELVHRGPGVGPGGRRSD